MAEIFWVIIVGAVAGALAKMVMPGDKMEPVGCLMTTLLGVAGAILMGWFVVPLLGIDPNGTLIARIIGATIGAAILIAIGRMLQGRMPKA